MNEQALLPCPFCGDDGDKGRQTVTQMNAERATFVRIQCRLCGAMAPELNWQVRASEEAQTGELGQWVTCSPALISAGVSCKHTPRRANTELHDHDHWISFTHPAADRELRASNVAGDVAMPIAMWMAEDKDGIVCAVRSGQQKDLLQLQALECVIVQLVKLPDAQAALAAKDAEIAALKARSKTLPLKVAYAANNALHEEVALLKAEIARLKSEVARPESTEVSLLRSVYSTEIAALTAERDGLRKDALRAATVAFGLMAEDYPDDLPEDAAELAEWLDTHAFALLPDDMRPEELFIHIIRAAMTKETK